MTTKTRPHHRVIETPEAAWHRTEPATQRLLRSWITHALIPDERARINSFDLRFAFRGATGVHVGPTQIHGALDVAGVPAIQGTQSSYEPDYAVRVRPAEEARQRMSLHFPTPAEEFAELHPDDQAVLEDWIGQFIVPGEDARISLFDLCRAFLCDTGYRVTPMQMRGALEAWGREPIRGAEPDYALQVIATSEASKQTGGQK